MAGGGWRRFAQAHGPAVVRHLLWTVLGGAVVPLLLVFALITWSSDDGAPEFVALVGRGELFLVAVGLFIATMRDIVKGIVVAQQKLFLEMTAVAVFLAALFSIVPWATLIEVAITAQTLSRGQEHLATFWGTTTASVAAGLSTMMAAVADTTTCPTPWNSRLPQAFSGRRSRWFSSSYDASAPYSLGARRRSRHSSSAGFAMCRCSPGRSSWWQRTSAAG